MEGLEDLERWAADARAREAADAKVRERWLRVQAEESSSVAGILLSMAERRDTVLVTTLSGARHRGAVIGVGMDFVALAVASGTTTLVALAMLAQVRSVTAERRPTTGAALADVGDRSAFGVRLVDVLGQAAGQRPRISVHAGTASVVGDLQAVGDDVLTLRADGGAGLVYVPLRSVSEVSFLASG